MILTQMFLWELKEQLNGELALLLLPDVETKASLMKNFVVKIVSLVLIQWVCKKGAFHSHDNDDFFPCWSYMMHIQSCVFQTYGSCFSHYS